MATWQPGSETSFFLANATLATKQFYLAKLHTVSGEVVLCGAGEKAIGVIGNKPGAGASVTLALIAGGGIVRVVVDGTTDIAIGDTLKSDASGVGVKGVADGDLIIGTALEAYTSATVGYIDVLLSDSHGRGV